MQIDTKCRKERYLCNNYKNSPFCKGAEVWDSVNLQESKECLKKEYHTFDNALQ